MHFCWLFGLDCPVTNGDVCLGVARVGSPTQHIVACPIDQMVNQDLGPPLHSLVIPGKLHPLESDYIAEFIPRNTVENKTEAVVL